MITIIHGDDIVKSRNFLSEQKKKAIEYHNLNVNDVTIENLSKFTHGTGFFSDSKKVFVENYLSKTKSNSKYFKEVVNFINKNSSLIDLFLWEDDTVSVRNINAFSKTNVLLFKLPQHIFQFLDAVKPNMGKVSVALFHKVLPDVEVEQIFFMMIRQFRMLLAVSDEGSKDNIDEISRLQPWQKSKLKNQSRLFDEKSLKNLYAKLYDLDTRQKTGNLTMSLSQSIDFLLLEI